LTETSLRQWRGFKLFAERILESFHKEKESLVSDRELKASEKEAQQLKSENLNPEDIKVEEALRKERERILKNKYSKQTETESDEDLIKEN
jgi:hypothetical protein